MPLARKTQTDPRSLQARIDEAMGVPVRRRRTWRFVAGLLVTWCGIWGAVAAYILYTPVAYTSHWSLILPGSGSSSSVSLDTIGQASSAPSNQFSSSSLSPKVIYKEIAQSDQVRAAAAMSLGMSFGAFGRPRIRLIEETSLLLFEIKAETRELAQRKAVAVERALQQQLDVLRRDEIAKRAAAVAENLKGYKEQVAQARARILDAQRTTGLASVNQYNEMSTSVVLAKRRLVELHAETERIAQEQASLMERLGVDAHAAGLALRLSGDPAFSRLATEYAEANAIYQADTKRLGSENPLMINSEKRRSAALEQLIQFGLPLVGSSGVDIERIALLLNGTQRAELLRSIVANEALVQGRRSEMRALEQQIAGLQSDLKTLGEAASKLEDLRKDQIVAEAVLTSAMARLDTSKSDLYGSYPLVQTLAAPDLPDDPSQPIEPLAMAGGLAGSLLSAFAWMLLWWQLGSSRGRRKNG